MAAVTTAILKTDKLDGSRMLVDAALTFGDGSTTYPSGGIPLPGSVLGMPRYVDSLFFDNNAQNTYQLRWDGVNQKIRIYVEGAAIYAEMTGTIPSFTASCHAVGSK